MCLGQIAVLVDSWEDGAARIGVLEDGSRVSLSFVPDATRGDYVLVHLGVPVEILDARTAREALALRTSAERAGEVPR
jgi:hydrogenase maturation factor